MKASQTTVMSLSSHHRTISITSIDEETSGTRKTVITSNNKNHHETNPPPKYRAIGSNEKGSLEEFSVVFTNRSLNLMSDPFIKIMQDVNELLKYTYNAHRIAILPGSGTFGMEAVARSFATGKHVMVIRNGWFSYRWTQIFNMNHPKVPSIPRSHTVLKAQPMKSTGTRLQYEPYPVESVVRRIQQERPAVMFAPHVETSTGIILPDEYIQQVASALHKVNGIFVLDCIASGALWVDMKQLGIDVVISAPQKGWTGSAGFAIVGMSEKATKLLLDDENDEVAATTESSFSLSLKNWTNIMDSYENGTFGYYTTIPTDCIRIFHEVSVEILKHGLPSLKQAQLLLGQRTRELFERHGLISVAAPNFGAPGVLVFYTPECIDNPTMLKKFKDHAGLQIAMGVQWKIDEPAGTSTFRVGLFGLDKICNIDGTLLKLDDAIKRVLQACQACLVSKL